MKCPECGAKISTKHFDVSYDWYECPKCEGCFTADEIEEAENGTSPGKRSREVVKKSLRKAAASHSEPRRTRVVSNKSSAPLAKGKKRQSEIAEDLEALKKREEEWLKPVESEEPVQTKHKDDVGTREVVNIMADELQDIYTELGGRLDEINAQDKALTLWRQVRLDTGISSREQDVSYVTCADHA